MERYGYRYIDIDICIKIHKMANLIAIVVNTKNKCGHRAGLASNHPLNSCWNLSLIFKNW